MSRSDERSRSSWRGALRGALDGASAFLRQTPQPAASDYLLRIDLGVAVEGAQDLEESLRIDPNQEGADALRVEVERLLDRPARR